MRLSTLILATALALGSGFTGSAIAHDQGGRGYGYSHHDHGRDHYRYRRHGHHRGHRHWRPAYRAYRPYYRHHHRPHRPGDDSWYGIHLFLGGS